MSISYIFPTSIKLSFCWGFFFSYIFPVIPSEEPDGPPNFPAEQLPLKTHTSLDGVCSSSSVTDANSSIPLVTDANNSISLVTGSTNSLLSLFSS